MTSNLIPNALYSVRSSTPFTVLYFAYLIRGQQIILYLFSLNLKHGLKYNKTWQFVLSSVIQPVSLYINCISDSTEVDQCLLLLINSVILSCGLWQHKLFGNLSVRIIKLPVMALTVR